MEELRQYLNSLSTEQQRAFCEACGTTVGYLRKAISVGQSLREGLVISIERESSREVRVEQLRPDVDWAFLRSGGRSGGEDRPAA